MKKLLCILSFIICTILILSFPASADTGPKPSWDIEISNLEESDYLVGILVDDDYFVGPHTLYKDLDRSAENYFGNNDDLDLINSKITIPDGYYLTDISYNVKSTTTLSLRSGYYYPRTFKLVIYDTKKDKVYTSGLIECKAFNANLSVDFNNLTFDIVAEGDPNAPENEFHVTEIAFADSSSVWGEIGAFLLRLGITLVIELGIALLFKFRGKSLVIILITNIVTQIALNIYILLFTMYNGRQFTLYLSYAFIELLIMAIECSIYKLFTVRTKEETKKLTALYGIVANLSSFIFGLILFTFI